MARKLEYYFRETASGLRRNGLVAFAAVSTVFIAAFLFGGAQLIGRQIDTVVEFQTERVEVAIYLRDDITQQERQAVQDKLQALPEVASVTYESKSQAYRRFQDLFRNQPALVDNVSADALPASFRVKLVDPQKFEVVRATLGGYPGIEPNGIVDQSALLKRLFAVSNVLKLGARLAAAIMLIASIGLIANTVRMAVFARRKEIGIMRLVGATNWFIRAPFLIEALVESLLGAVLAVGVLLFMQRVFFNQIHGSIAFIPIIPSQAVIAQIPLLIVGAIVIALLASWLAMRRFLEV